MRPTITYKIAMAAGEDAGNRNARKHGRSAWNEDDWNVAAATTQKLLEGVRRSVRREGAI